MCPACWTSLAITAATTTGVGASVVALALRVKRWSKKRPQPETRAEHHEQA
jgi:hypothetical protein